MGEVYLMKALGGLGDEIVEGGFPAVVVHEQAAALGAAVVINGVLGGDHGGADGSVFHPFVDVFDLVKRGGGKRADADVPMTVGKGVQELFVIGDGGKDADPVAEGMKCGGAGNFAEKLEG